MALIEWLAAWRNLSRTPWALTLAALIATAWLVVRMLRLRVKVRSLKLGRDFPVRGVVVFPRWWIEQTNKDRPREVWVLEPKALPKFIENSSAVISAEDVAMAAYHLSRYVRRENRSQ